MTPFSTICSFGRSSRKRDAGQTVAECAVVLGVSAISVAVVFVVLSGGVTVTVERVVDLIPNQPLESGRAFPVRKARSGCL